MILKKGIHGCLTIACAALFLIENRSAAHATAIVAIRSADAVGIAADSLVTVKGSSLPAPGQTECKIGEEAEVIFALTGFAADPDRSFDLRRVIRSALAEEGETPADRVARAASGALDAELNELRTSAPDLFDRFIAVRKGPLARVLLAGFNDETPWIEVISFAGGIREQRVAIEVVRQRCPGDCNPDRINSMFLADGKQMEQALRSDKIRWEKPEQAAELLVEQVIRDGTPGVGPPVDVVRIDRDGVSWLARKPSCDDESE